jgi:hypothetical protein
MRATFRIASVANVKTCSSTELTQLAGVAETSMSSPDCASSALGSSLDTVDELCAGPCLKLIQKLLPLTPDCETDGGEVVGAVATLCASNLTTSEANDVVPTCTVDNITLSTI